MTCKLSLIALVLFYTDIESINASLSYKYGDFMIGVLLPITKGHNCRTVNHGSVQLVETIIDGVQRINIHQELLSNMTIGYDIRDTCLDPTVAVKETSNLISGKRNGSRSCVEKTLKCGNEVIAILGPQILENIILTAGSLSFYKYPQVILTGKTRLLSNRAMYSLLNSIVPSVGDTAEALTLLIASFGWKSVNIIGSDDAYGREATALLNQNLRAKNICISTQHLLGSSKRTKDTRLREFFSLIRSKHHVRVTVLLASPDTTIRVLDEARKQNFTGHVWIGSETWVSDVNIVRRYSSILEGMLGTSYIGKSWEFPRHLRNKIQRTRYSDWLRGMYPTKNISNFGPNSQIIDRSLFAHDVMNNMLTGISVIAHALGYVVKRETKSPRYDNPLDVNLTRVRNEMKNVLPAFVLQKVKPLQLKIINLQRQLSGESIFRFIGRWTRNESQEGTIVLHKENIRWPGKYELQVPFSGNSAPCNPGTYVKNDLTSCIWKCLPCPLGTYSENYTSPNCNKCLEGKIPNKLQTRCTLSDQEYLKLIDPFGISILSACALGIVTTGAVLAIFLKYQNTPVVKASNMGFCLFTLVLLMLWFLSPVLFLGRPMGWTCKLRTVCIPLLYTSVSALILTKTKRLIRIFSALKRNRFLSNYWYSFVACSIVLLQIVFCSIYLVFFPPKLLLIYERNGKISLHCTRNLALEITSLSYNCLLAVLCALFAMKSRNLPETYSEAKHICFTMLTYMISWIIYFLGYYGIKYGNLKAAIPSFGVIVGAFAVLFFIFIPKIRVIFFWPEKNTKMAALAGTRKYSVDVAAVVNITVPNLSRACERRHTLATLPAYHEAGLPFSSNSDNHNENKTLGLSALCLAEPIREVDLEEEHMHAQEEMNGSINFVLKGDVNPKISRSSKIPNGHV